ncbi:MAG: 23S rRNA (adenine(2503)-C(2))-methyltransferase RlmN [Clostridia bacterium]|nr:23S rRNA (adenine(2503)-C(2))-methyltransferase RlmN [Clostridia bacterium]
MNLGDLTYSELEKYILSAGESKWRAKQIFSWIARGAASFEEMSDISKPLRMFLAQRFEIYLPQIVYKAVSKADGTVKYLMRMSDGNVIESVVMKYRHGYSICVSSQVGCAMGCTFCASTIGGKMRNLAPHEILGQLTAAARDLSVKISNIVVMGIGEPLDNYHNLMIFLYNVQNEFGVNIGFRHITVSTCGLVDRIRELAQENIPINLALSLHAADDETRRAIMPVAKRYTIAQTLEACDFYFETTHRRVSYEYALIGGVNNSKAHAKKLAELLRGRNCHVNLIRVNPIKEREVEKTSEQDAENFRAILEKHNITTTIRRTLGADIDASCGQLRAGHTEV